MSFMRIFKFSLISSFAIFAMTSCGGSTNNDQGTSFLALGWFIGSGTDVSPSTQVDATISGAANLAGAGRAEFRLLGVENRLETQFIRITRVDCSYDVQGGDPSLIIPNDSVSKSFVLGANPGSDVLTPAGDAQIGSADENARPTVFFISVPVITTDVLAFLNANINLLPQLPFTMTTTCEAVGITQAGDVLTTNPASISVLLSEAISVSVATSTGTTLAADEEDEAPSFTTGDDSEEEL